MPESSRLSDSETRLAEQPSAIRRSESASVSAINPTQPNAAQLAEQEVVAPIQQDQSTARLEHATELRENFVGAAETVKTVGADDDVERIAVEWKTMYVCFQPCVAGAGVFYSGAR